MNGNWIPPPRNFSEELRDPETWPSAVLCSKIQSHVSHWAIQQTRPNYRASSHLAASRALPTLHARLARYDASSLHQPEYQTNNLWPRAHGGERPQLRWRQRLRSATSPSPTRESTAARHPARRRSSRTSASPSTPANDASSSAPTAQVTPITRLSTLSFVSLGYSAVD